MITDFKDLDLSKRYTYADYITWQFDDMVELIKGKIFKMSPAPNMKHQRISLKLSSKIDRFLEGNKCEVFTAPFDVRLSLPKKKQTKDKIDTVVQPDVCVICDLNKLDKQGCIGAPDWVIEILSKSTSKKDLTEKFDIYQEAGVKEYWIVRPDEESVTTYLLDGSGSYKIVRQKPYLKEESVPVSIFPGFEIVLSEVFPDF